VFYPCHREGLSFTHVIEIVGVYLQFLLGETSVLRTFNQRMMHFLQSWVDGYEDRPHSYEPMAQGVSGSDSSPSQGSVPQPRRGRNPDPES